MLAATATLAVLVAARTATVTLAAHTRDAELASALAEAETHLKHGRPAQALRRVSAFTEDGRSTARLLTTQGLAWAALDRPDTARPLLERSRAIDPDQPMAAKVLAAIYFSQNESSRGFEMLAAAARLDPEDFRPWYGAGDMYRRLNRPAPAVDAFEQALRRKPDDYPSFLGLIWASLASRPPEQVNGLLDRALRQNPNDPHVLALAARHAQLLRRDDAAMAHAEHALALDPHNVDALLTRARLHHSRRDFAGALGDAERAASLTPNSPAALFLLAQVESALGLEDRSAATSLLHRALVDRLDRIERLAERVEAHPFDAEPRWQLGDLAAETGMPGLAVRSYRRALALDPGCQPAARGLQALGARAADPFIVPPGSPP